MNTKHSETTNNLKLAESYYSAMLKKDFDTMAHYLHENVHFIGPLAEMHGRDGVVSAVKNISPILEDIKIRSQFADGNQIMFAYDFTFSANIEKLRSAVLMEFQDNQISKIELFYDGRPFDQKKEDIFGDSTNA